MATSAVLGLATWSGVGDQFRRHSRSRQEVFMSSNEHKRREVLQALTVLPLMDLVMQPGKARAQTPGSPVRVQTV